MVGNFGAMIQLVGASWAMTTLSGSATMVGLVHAASAFPIMLLALPAGALADVVERRSVMLVAQCVMFLASATLALCAFQDALTPILLLMLVGAVGVGTALYNPSWQASIRDQVPLRDVPAAIALNAAGFNLARCVGPALGGVLIGTMGIGFNFAINTLSYIALILVLFRWRPASAPRAAEKLHHAIGAGVRFVLTAPGIRSVLLRVCIFTFGTAALWALMPLIARDVLGGDQLTYGIILGGFGVGSVVGALVAAQARGYFGSPRLFAFASAGCGLGSLIVAVAPNLLVALPGIMLVGANWVIGLATVNVTVQISAPRALAGRCLAYYHMLAFGGLGAGSYGWGSLADAYGLRWALGGAGLLLLLSPLLQRIWPIAEIAAEPVANVTATPCIAGVSP